MDQPRSGPGARGRIPEGRQSGSKDQRRPGSPRRRGSEVQRRRSASPRRRRGRRRPSSSRSQSRSRSRYRRRRNRSGRASNSSRGSWSSSSGDGDSAGRIRVREGDCIGRNGRYRVKYVAGEGTFGTVLRVVDTKYGDELAVKVVRSVPRYLEAARVEEEVLMKLREKDPTKTSGTVRIKGRFEMRWRGRKHYCISFEPLGQSLYDFIKGNDYRGFTWRLVRSFGFQLLKAIGFCHDLKLTHTDLKPENILLVAMGVDDKLMSDGYRMPKDDRIRLIDFGGATFRWQHHSRIISTRQYRAPEVIFGLPWGEPSDLWSVGCILAELRTGSLLFQTHEDVEHLALMEKILERRVPVDMCKRATLRERRKEGGSDPRKSRSRRDRSSSQPCVADLIRDGAIRWPERSSGAKSVSYVRETSSLSEMFTDQKTFTDLLYGLLEFDPAKRISAKEALQHPFFDPCRAQFAEARTPNQGPAQQASAGRGLPPDPARRGETRRGDAKSDGATNGDAKRANEHPTSAVSSNPRRAE